MKPFRDDTELAEALREIRPTPQPEFAAELDARAAAGFRRDSRWASAASRIRARLTSTPPRRLIAPVGALALAAVVATTESGDRTATERAPQTQLSQTRPGAAAVPSSGAGAATDAESAGEASTQSSAQPALPLNSGPYASGAGHRDVERSAEIVLGAEPTEVRADAAEVFDAVHAADGIVLRSSIRDGEAGDAGADFELLIPSARVGDAMASFSSIAEVRSRHESTQDITAPTVSVGEKLQDSRATVASLLGQLAAAETDAERAAVEAQLHAERHRVAALRSRLSSLNRRANFSHVLVRIETGATSSSGKQGGVWGIGNGLDDAGRILAVAAGVIVIGLAILAPFALIALLGWLCRRAWLRRARRDALSRT
jgi:hypothetical protein